MRVPERNRDTKGNGCAGEEVMVVGTSRCSLSLSSRGDAETRSSGRPVGRSVGIGRLPSREAKLGRPRLHCCHNKKKRHSFITVTLSRPLPSHSLRPSLTQPAHNLSQELLNPLLSSVN